MDLEMTGFVGMDDQFRKETLLHQVHPTIRIIGQQIDLQMPEATYGEYFNYLLDRVEINVRPDDMPSQGYSAQHKPRFQKGRPRSNSMGRQAGHDRGRSQERKGSSQRKEVHRGTSRSKPFKGKCNNCKKVGHMQRDCRSARRQSYSAQDDEQESYVAYMGFTGSVEVLDEQIPDLSYYSDSDEESDSYSQFVFSTREPLLDE
jgi:hypothetical protein